MTINQLTDFFEENGFNVYQFEQDGQQCAELEKWTSGGVDMIIALMPFSKDEFINYVNEFDIDEKIDFYRKDKQYKAVFTISQSLADFTEFNDMIKEVAEKLKKRSSHESKN